jgi:dimethylhistidine N-methyltransferase
MTLHPLKSPTHASRPPLSLVKDTSPASGFAHELLAALAARPRSIAPKFFYDAAGSALFDRICDLPEYYPTRTEMGLLARHAPEMADLIGPDADIIEFGAGSATKIRLLLNALSRPLRFVPIDISAEHLHTSVAGLRRDHPGLDVRPLAADFTQPLTLPPLQGPAPARRVGFFPGSSIGNFSPAEAEAFLCMAAQLLQGGGLLVGVDLVKDPVLLHRAYNDAAGVTAAFNRNLLARANRELDADFVTENFAHYAFYAPHAQRIEMHLVSQCPQTVRVAGRSFEFAQGDSLHTENSHKFTLGGFQALARRAGLEPAAVWTDPQQLFSIHWLAAPVRPSA